MFYHCSKLQETSIGINQRISAHRLRKPLQNKQKQKNRNRFQLLKCNNKKYKNIIFSTLKVHESENKPLQCIS